MPKIKNIIIFLIIGVILVSVYLFYTKKTPSDSSALVSSSASSVVPNAVAGNTNDNVTQEFLTLLLSVNNIKLDDTIFSDVAFTHLDGSHGIALIPDGTEGRINPFAPLGADTVVVSPVNTGSPSSGAKTGLKALP